MSKIITNQISPRSGDTVTINGSISVGGTVTYQDVTNVDSIGVITARSGIIVTGIVTATSFEGDGAKLSGVGGESDITSSLFI